MGVQSETKETSGRLDALLRVMASGDRSEQRRACEEAAELLRRRPALREKLRAIIEKTGEAAAWPVAFALFRAGTPPDEALRVAVAVLGSGDSDLRWAAREALVGVAPQLRTRVVELLVEAVRCGPPQQRKMALYALRDMPDGGLPAAAAARAALRDDDWAVRLAAASALGQLRGAAAAPEVAALLRDRDLRVARGAAAILAGMGPAASGVRQALREACERGDHSLQRAARRALDLLAQAAGD